MLYQLFQPVACFRWNDNSVLLFFDKHVFNACHNKTSKIFFRYHVNFFLLVVLSGKRATILNHWKLFCGITNASLRYSYSHKGHVFNALNNKKKNKQYFSDIM